MSEHAAVERHLAIEDERQARAAVLDLDRELTTDELDAYDAAKARREELGIPEAEVGPWETEREQGIER